MLVLKRKKKEYLVLETAEGKEIVVQVIQLSKKYVKLGVVAEQSVNVVRGPELKQSKHAAA